MNMLSSLCLWEQVECGVIGKRRHHLKGRQGGFSGVAFTLEWLEKACITPLLCALYHAFCPPCFGNAKYHTFTDTPLSNTSCPSPNLPFLPAVSLDCNLKVNVTRRPICLPPYPMGCLYSPTMKCSTNVNWY